MKAILVIQMCGSLDKKGDKTECDMCKHVKYNPIGSSLPKCVINKGQVLLPRGKEEPQPKKEEVPADRCGICLGEKRPGIKHLCGPSAKKQNICKIINESSENDCMAIVGTSIKLLAESNKHQGWVGTVRVEHVTGGPKWVVSVGKDEDKKYQQSVHQHSEKYSLKWI